MSKLVNTERIYRAVFGDTVYSRRAWQDRLPRRTSERVIWNALSRHFTDPSDFRGEILRLYLERVFFSADVIPQILYGEGYQRVLPPLGKREWKYVREQIRAFDVTSEPFLYDGDPEKDNLRMNLQSKMLRHALKSIGLEKSPEEKEILRELEARYHCTNEIPLYPLGDIKCFFSALVWCASKVASMSISLETRQFVEIFLGIIAEYRNYHCRPWKRFPGWEREHRKSLLSACTPRERNLVTAGVLRVEEKEVNSLEYADPEVSREEIKEIRRRVGNFYRDNKLKPSPYYMKNYMDAYKEMKRILMIVPHFLEHLFSSFQGSYVFLDRDMRLFYIAARAFARRFGYKNGIYLVPVTRVMVPPNYSKAYKEQYGGLSFVDAFSMRQPRYAFVQKQETAIEIERKREELLRGERIGTSEFREGGNPMIDYLNHIGALETDNITIIDIGVLGTCASYLRDLLKAHYPTKDVKIFLFFSSNNAPNYLETLPNFHEASINNISLYETLPIGLRGVTGYRQRGEGFIPDYHSWKDEERHWILGKPNEVKLGERLVHMALGRVMHAYFERKDKH